VGFFCNYIFPSTFSVKNDDFSSDEFFNKTFLVPLVTIGDIVEAIHSGSGLSNYF
jgi:hypothetical protein